MKQLSKGKIITYHLYPGIVITLCFVTLTPILIDYNYPPQLSMLICILLVAVPFLVGHLLLAKKEENHKNILALNGFRNKLPVGKLILYSFGLVLFAFLIWGITQPLDQIITKNLFGWLPDWYTLQDFSGYDQSVIRLTLIINLLLNGLLAPFVEELYFRGYLLPRMKTFGKKAFVVNAVLFSLYHFWQPYLYLTLVIALLPMTYMVWKTGDLRLGILTHCLLNVIGAILTFAMIS